VPRLVAPGGRGVGRCRSGKWRRSLNAVCWLYAASLFLACASELAPPRNVLLVSLDTTRLDHLSTYGYARPTAPNLDRLAEHGVVFRNALAQWTATNPSHTSMFTGLYPHTHGVGTNTARLPEHLSTLAELLGDAGLSTGAFVSGYTLRAGKSGIDRGFDVYDGQIEGTRRDGRETGERAIEWLAGLSPDEPWFLFLHLYDAHGPYRGDGRYLDLFRSDDRGPRLEYIPEYQRRRDRAGRPLKHLNDYLDRYDAEIRYQDEVLGDVLATLDLSRTLVVVVADHGETMTERSKGKNLSHATGVHDEQIRIPFVVRSPGLLPAVYREVVETVDILPTVLDLLDLPAPASSAFEGESLAPLMRGQRRERHDSLGFSSVWARQDWQDRERSIQTVRSERWKLIAYPALDGDRVRLFDLIADPGERIDVGIDYPEIRQRLLAEIDSWQRTDVAPAEEVELTAEDVENLKALGYLD